SAEAICFDVRDHQVCGDALEALVERIGPIQVIVNNAGIHDDVPLAGMSEAQWHNVVSVSLDGFFNVTRPLLLHMLSTRWGRIVNNAGIHDDVPLAGMSEAQWHNVVSVSLDGFFNVTRPLLLHMLSTRWGRIVNLSSVSGLIGNRGQVNYAAAKAGLHGATKAL